MMIRYDRASTNDKLDDIQLKLAKIILKMKKPLAQNKAFSYLMSMVPYCYHENQLKNI